MSLRNKTIRHFNERLETNKNQTENSKQYLLLSLIRSRLISGDSLF